MSVGVWLGVWLGTERESDCHGIRPCSVDYADCSRASLTLGVCLTAVASWWEFHPGTLSSWTKTALVLQRFADELKQVPVQIGDREAVAGQIKVCDGVREKGEKGRGRERGREVEREVERKGEVEREVERECVVERERGGGVSACVCVCVPLPLSLSPSPSLPLCMHAIIVAPTCTCFCASGCAR